MIRRARRGGDKRDADSNTLELECSLCKAWGELYETGQHSDITFTVGRSGKQFNAHKLVLSTHSSTFRAMLYNGMEESSQSVIQLPEQDSNVFELLLRFMYTGQVKLHKDVVRNLMILADYYAVEVLKESIGEWIGKTLIDRNNVCDYIVFASNHNVHSLYKHCYRFMLGNAKDIFFSAEFRNSIPYEILEKMVASDDLNLTELELFNSLILWGESRVELSPHCRTALSHNMADHTTPPYVSLSESSDDERPRANKTEAPPQPSNTGDTHDSVMSPEGSQALRTILEPLISHVRLPFIDPEQLIECVKPTGVIDHSNILQAISYHISKKPVYPPHHVQIRPRKNTIETRYTLMKNREPHKSQPFLHSETAGGEDDSSSW